MKIKWKLITLLSVLMAITLFVGCNNKPDNGGKEPPVIIQYVDIIEDKLEIERFDSKKLNVKLTDITGTVAWSSSDTSIVTVSDDGAVIAKNEGTVTITAAIGDKTDTCAIKVVDGNSTLEFADIRDVNLMRNKSIQLDSTLVYKREIFSISGLEVVYVLESDKDLVSVDEFGTLTAKGTLGSQKVTAKALLDGTEITSKEFTVTIYEEGMIETGVQFNTVTLVNTIAMDGTLKKYTLPKAIAKIDGQTVEKDIAIEVVDGENAIDFADGVVTAVMGGKATLKLSFTAESGNEYSTEITVEVLEVATEGNTYFAQSETNLVQSDNVILMEDGDILFDVKVIDDQLSAQAITAITVNGDAVTESNVVCGLIKFNCNVVGNVKLVVTANGQDYEYELVSSDCVLKTFADFYYYRTGKDCAHTSSGVRRVTTTADNAKYVILANDITSPTGTSAVSTQVDSSFVPEAGSVFDGNGYAINGIYSANGWFPNSRTVENFTFKNLTLNNYMIHKYSAFGYKLDNCLFDNVEVHLTGVNEYTYTNTDYGGTSLLCLYPYNVTVKNSLLAFFVPEKYIDYSYKLTRDEPNKDTGISYYKTTLENVELATNANLALLGETSTGGYVTGANGSITANSTYTVTEGKDFIAKNDNGTAGYVLTNVGGKEIALNKLGDIGTIEKIVVGVKNVDFELTETSLICESSIGGTSRIFKTSKGWYKDTTVYADYAIKSVAEFKDWASNAGNYMYAILANDISGDLTLGHGNAANTFEIKGMKSGAIFNGLNHKISNMYASNGWFGNRTGTKGVTIMNVEFENFKFNNYALIGRIGGATLKNVTISAVDNGTSCGLWTTNDNWEALIMLGNNASTLVLDNTKITLTMSKTDALVLTQNSGVIKLNNGSSITTNCTIAIVGEMPWNTTLSAVSEGTYVVDSTSSITDKDGKVA